MLVFFCVILFSLFLFNTYSKNVTKNSIIVIQEKLDNAMLKMVEDCNRLIEKQRIKFANYRGPDADKIKELLNQPLLNGLADIDKLKGHPICY